MIHPRDQWFTVYRRLRIEVVNATIVAARVFEPTPGEPAHVVHPDAYHPDGVIRRQHAQRRFETGVIETACGKKVTSRDVVISASPGEPCAECLEAQESSIKEHEAAQTHVDRLRIEQREFDEIRAQLFETAVGAVRPTEEASDGTLVGVEKNVDETEPEAVGPEVVDEALAPTDEPPPIDDTI